MALTARDVRRIAALAGIRLAPEEVVAMTDELDGILGHMRSLAAAPDSEGQSPDNGGRPILRDDRPTPDPLLIPLRHMAPGWQKGFFTVPRLASHEPPTPPPMSEGDEGS